MLAIAFILVLIILVAALALSGQAPSIGVTELVVISVVFVVFFLSGIYVAAALGMLGLLADLAFSSRPVNPFLGQIAWNASANFLLVAIPLFILMGEILLRSGLSDRLYRSLNLWFGRLPGGLLHTNVVASAVFSAVSGSSPATAATIGSVALPYFEKSRYDQKLVLGSLAGGGALGNLIPPGISLIVYALFTDTSVGQLYAAAMVAGVLVTVLFMLFILAISLARGSAERVEGVTWRERLASLPHLVPTATLILLVLGTIYFGLATATESAALGVVGSLALALSVRRLDLAMLRASVRATARTTGMIGLIVLGAFVLNYVLTTLRLPQMLAGFISELPYPSWSIMALIIFFYIALGTFMESLSMMITTLPVIFPVVTALGYDPIWFGVVMTMLIEMAMISPPDGIVMYVLQGLRGGSRPITDIYVGVLPFLAMYAVGLALVFLFPGLILWPVR